MIRINSTGSPLLSTNQGGRTYVSNNGPGSGIVRYNTQSQQLEVFDGQNWTQYYQDINLVLSQQIEYLLQWVDTKRAEDRELDRLCKEYPNLAEARQEFEILRRLVRDAESDVKDNF